LFWGVKILDFFMTDSDVLQYDSAEARIVVCSSYHYKILANSNYNYIASYVTNFT